MNDRPHSPCTRTASLARGCAVAALLVSVLLAATLPARAAEVPDYTGWQITVTGTETTTCTFHGNLAFPLDDKCSIVRHGTSKYVITRDPNLGPGLESYSTKLVSASTDISVTGEGKAVFQGGRTANWTYHVGEYPKDVETFCPGSGGVPPSSPDEPMFMFRRIMVESYLPEGDWGVTPEDCGSLAKAKDEAILAWSEADGGDHPPLEFIFPHRLDAQHLTASGSRTFDHTNKIIEEETSTAHIEVTYNVVVTPATGQRKPPQVELDEIDDKWLPEDGNTITATMRVNGGKTAQAFRFTLYDVSRQTGICCNSQNASTNPDLTFTHEQPGWTVVEQTNATAQSNNEGTEASIEINCHDWGAWGKLKAEAKIDGQWKPAKVTGSGLNFVRIPYDDDDDHIADSWQADKGVGDKAAKDDSGKQPTDQANDGDGLSIYEDYRGFYVIGPDGAQQHVRLDPRRKALFVLDKSNYFVPALWEQSSGIPVYMLTSAMCHTVTLPDSARVVNFRSDYARNGDKYCVVVTLVPEAHKDSDGDMPMGLCEDSGGGPKCPRDVTGLYLYPGNATSIIGAATTDLGIAVAQPNSSQAQAYDKLGLPRRMWKNALDRLMNETFRQSLADQIMRQTAVHEMGHACGLWGHYKAGDPAKQETFGLGNKSCPMYYSEAAENMRYLILQVLFSPNASTAATFGQFCKDDLNCWSHLNVKDN